MKKKITVAVAGNPNSGKTTVFNLVSGFYQPTEGQILVDGKPTAGFKPHKVTALGVARTFQNLKVFARLSVLENVLTGLTIFAERAFTVSMLRLPALRHQERQLRLRALEALDEFGLAHKATWPASTLAYGEKNGWRWHAPSSAIRRWCFWTNPWPG